jgi:hypothetical protein
MMKRYAIIAIALTTLMASAQSGFAAKTKSCFAQIPPGENDQLCGVKVPPMTANYTAITYSLDNTQNATLTFFQIYDDTKYTSGETALQVFAVPAGAAEVVTSGDVFVNGILFNCATTAEGNAPTLRGCTFTAWYQ